MLKIAIEVSYDDKILNEDKFGSKFFMQEFFLKNDIELVRVSINKFNKKKWTFDEYNILDNNSKIIKISKAIKPDIVWIRNSSFIAYKCDTLKEFILVPSRKIITISWDKLENYKYLEEFQPQTFSLNGFLRNKYIQDQLKDKIIIKPIRSSWGKWIKLLKKSYIIKNIKKYSWLENLFIVQEFKNFGWWYKDIVKWIHDFRLMFAWKSIIEATVRTPEAWDFRSNIQSWGKQKNLAIKEIPKELVNLSKIIYKKLELENHDIFSMDFAYCSDDKKWYLLEINSSPGTWYYQEDKRILENICKWFVKFFKNISKK